MSLIFSNDFKLFFPDFAMWMENIELTLDWEEILHVLYEDCPKLDLSETSSGPIQAYDR